LNVQRARFEAQVQTHNATMAAAAEYAKAKGDIALASAANDAYEVGMDEDFVTALEYGMPPTAGMVRTSNLVLLSVESVAFRTSKLDSGFMDHWLHHPGLKFWLGFCRELESTVW
jgi:predicted nuclease of predicted toxin-antitoxin system